MTTPHVSFEFFPPKTLEASFKLWETAKVLAPLAPDFVSVTYGAGGTTRDRTVAITAPVAGLVTAMVAPSSASHHTPSIRHCCFNRLASCRFNMGFSL